MESAIGTKKVLFRAMNRGDFIEYCGKDVDESENPEDEGYLVEYLDGGPSNHKDHDNYISWSPKDVFEAAYEATDKGMSFGHALVFLESGYKVAMKSVPNVIYESYAGEFYEVSGSMRIAVGYFTTDQVQAKDWVVME